MRLLELISKVRIPESQIHDINDLRTNIESELSALDLRNDFNENIITFKMINFIAISGNQSTNLQMFRIIKEGEIILLKKEDFYEIISKIKLDSLYFIAFCFSILISFLIRFNFKIEIILLILIGISIFILLIIFGIIIIKQRIKRIIDISVYYSR
jgi:hypothetical protein